MQKVQMSAWTWLASLVGLGEGPTPGETADDQDALIATLLRANCSEHQLKLRDPVEHQLERANYHCDFAKRQAHRLTLLLRDVVAKRDVLRGQAEEAAVLQARLRAQLQRALSERDAWRIDAHQLRNELLGRMAPHQKFMVKNGSLERDILRVQAGAVAAVFPTLLSISEPQTDGVDSCAFLSMYVLSRSLFFSFHCFPWRR